MHSKIKTENRGGERDVNIKNIVCGEISLQSKCIIAIRRAQREKREKIYYRYSYTINVIF